MSCLKQDFTTDYKGGLPSVLLMIVVIINGIFCELAVMYIL